MTQIKDPLYGYLDFNEREQRVIDSPQMQRLRRIQQLGLTSLVYPGATHTRFEHSLGVSHLAGRFADSLNLDEKRRKELRVAALLHDSGHGPFSHVSEEVARAHGKIHEDYSARIVRELEDVHGLDPDRLEKIIHGELELGSVVAGDIDADRMDYLMRDAHASGLEHGHIDFETIIRCAGIDSRRMVYDGKALEALEGLFTSRFHMIKTLYRHHAVEIAEKMVGRALEGLVDETGLDEMMEMDNYTAHCRLQGMENPSGRLYRRVKDRNLYKRTLVWGADRLEKQGLEEMQRRMDAREAEREIAEEAGVNREEVIVDPPKTPETRELQVRIKEGGEIASMEDLSPLPGALAEAEWRQVDLRVYSPRESREEVAEAAREVLPGYSEVLRKYF